MLLERFNMLHRKLRRGIRLLILGLLGMMRMERKSYLHLIKKESNHIFKSMILNELVAVAFSSTETIAHS